MPGLGRLVGYLRPYRWKLVATGGAMLVASLLEGFLIALLIPVFRLMFGVAASVGAVSPVERGITLFTTWLSGGTGIKAGIVVAAILGTVVLKNIASFVAAYLGAVVQEGVTRDLRQSLFDHVLRLDLGYVQRMRGGQLSTRMAADVEQAHTLLRTAMQSLAGNGIMVIVYLAMLFALSFRLAAIMLLLAPLIAVATKPLFRKVRETTAHAAEQRGELTAIFSEVVSGARLVRMYGSAAEERKRFDTAVHGHVTGRLRAEALSLVTHPISEIFAGILFAVLIVIGMGWTSSGSLALRPEGFVAFLAVAMRMLPAVKRLAHFPAVVEGCLAGVNRVFAVMDVEADDRTRPDEAPFRGLRHAITFDRVTFGYGHGPDVLRHVSFQVERGTMVGLVGPSGAGKSTVLDLLVRFFDPRTGAIRFDEVPTTMIGRDSLRAAMGVVSQEGIIFNRTVHDNIAYGCSETMSRGEVVAAARLARADTFIEKLPQGYDTVLGERGTSLSGGERQRIALARALVRDPEILILDEATSALDPASDALIRETLQDVIRGRTVIVVAHRAATVADADRIVVMHEGRVVDTGMHGELLERCAVYRQMHDAALVG